MVVFGPYFKKARSAWESVSSRSTLRNMCGEKERKRERELKWCECLRLECQTNFHLGRHKLRLSVVEICQRKTEIHIFGGWQCDQSWRNFATLTKVSIFVQYFEGLFGIWQNCETTLVNVLCVWVNIHCCKGPKI